MRNNLFSVDNTSNVQCPLRANLSVDVKQVLVGIVILNSFKSGGWWHLIYRKVRVHISKGNVGKQYKQHKGEYVSPQNPPK